MNEDFDSTAVTTEPAADPAGDVFEDGFDASDLTDDADSAPDTDADEAEQDSPAAEETPADPPETKADAAKPDEGVIEVTLNGKPEKLTRDEAAQLIGRGKAWKEQQQKIDTLEKFRQEAAAADGFVKTLAAQSGMSVPDYIRFAKTQALMNAGVDEITAKERVKLDEDKAEIERVKAEQTAANAAAEAEKARKAREAEEFISAFPDIKFDTIPPEVWQNVKGGMTLTNAYLKHRLSKAEAEVSAFKQHTTNKQTTTGSVQGVGLKTKSDPFLEGWNS